ncbi:MSHA biogenesis protein MshI [Vibrio metschnikovii]|uniref:MSHA biogenesis protein MshI n=1 Tax=Vibrio metschnikovii TaxID=28172 RepID=UPI001C307553|nr:MSHA biogenesis protein MshI [Vibrio metschnikovii]
MKINTLFHKITRRVQQDRKLFAVVQPDAIYFSATQDSPLATRYPLRDGAWLTSLCQALQANPVKGDVVDVVLHAQLYQCYQMDKPAVPREEWSGALPFLLKDLISEKPTEIVADAYELSGSNKIQAYVISIKVILELAQALQSIGYQLGQVIPEQEIWANSVQTPHFLLLQRSREGQFKLDAFVDQRCYFQRTLRGVVAPVTGETSPALQLDGLALELQRSIDYLSSQLKGVALHQLKVCCDDEDHRQLVAALNERLNVKASPLSEEQQPPLSGQVLAHYLPLMTRPTLNFYPRHLHPKTDHFSLRNMIVALSGASLVMLAVAGFYAYQTTQLDHQVALAQQQTDRLNQQLAELQQQQAKHRPSAGKVAAIERIKQQIAGQQASLSAMDQFTHSQQEGYSGIMNALASVAHRDISLTHIEISPNRLDIQGLATEAKVIPYWIGKFKQQTPLVGRNFERLTMDRNEQDLVTFELKTQQGAR